MTSTPAERAAFDVDLDRGQVLSRRRLLRRFLIGSVAAMGAAFLLPLRSLGPRPSDRELDSSPWKAGTRVVTENGAVVHVDDVPAGGLVTIFPEGAVDSETGEAVLMRVEPDLLRPLPGRESWTPQGLIAYSKVCTHAGCPVGLYEANVASAAVPVPPVDVRRPRRGQAGVRAGRGEPAAAAARDRRERTSVHDRWVQRPARPVVLEPQAVRSRRGDPQCDSRSCWPRSRSAPRGCGGKSPSILHTHGSEASRIAGIWWLMFGLGAAVYAVVAVFIVWAIVRGPKRRGPRRPDRRQHLDRLGRRRRPRRHPRVLAVVTVQATSELRKPEAGALKVRGRREALVVGRQLSGHAGQQRQRDPSPRGPPGGDRARLRQRHPQLLGPGARGQGRHDPRPAQRAALHAPHAGHLHRRVCGVLRSRARPHGVRRGRAERHRLRPLDDARAAHAVGARRRGRDRG